MYDALADNIDVDDIAKTVTIESFFVVSKGIMQMTRIMNCIYKMNMTKIGGRKIVIIIIQRGRMIWDGWDTLWVRMNF